MSRAVASAYTRDTTLSFWAMNSRGSNVVKSRVAARPPNQPRTASLPLNVPVFGSSATGSPGYHPLDVIRQHLGKRRQVAPTESLIRTLG